MALIRWLVNAYSKPFYSQSQGSRPIKQKGEIHGMQGDGGFVVEVKQPVHLFLGGKSLGIQQGMSVWVGSPKSWVCKRIGWDHGGGHVALCTLITWVMM